MWTEALPTPGNNYPFRIAVEMDFGSRRRGVRNESLPSTYGEKTT